MMPLPVQTLFDLGLSVVGGMPVAERIVCTLLGKSVTILLARFLPCLRESVKRRVPSRLLHRLIDSTVASTRMSGCLE